MLCYQQAERCSGSTVRPPQSCVMSFQIRRVLTKEGTLAHEICELKLTADSLKTGTYTRRMNKIKKSELYQEEMQGFTDQYVDYVETLSNSLPEKPYMAVEKRVEFDEYVPDGFGTADCILICGSVMHVIDF